MNTQFHTPSFGDEFVDVQQQQIQSKRLRSMDSSLDEYHSANDETFGNTATPLNNCGLSSVVTASSPTTTTLAARKQLTTNSTTADPNEPAKPLSAYALFFRDTVSAIKQQNPNCSFQELSRIVASMWEALDPMHKNVYQKKNELARNEYLKQMRTYRLQQMDQPQQLDQQQQQVPLTVTNEQYNINNNPLLQTRPIVFTIARSNSTDATSNNSLNAAMSPSSQQQQQQLQLANGANALAAQPQYLQKPNAPQHQFNISSQQQHIYNAKPQEENANNNVNTLMPAPNAPTDPSPQQIQMLTEAGSVQKCTRDNCNKRAIINPDWEDEYCSNECVVIHCRNVFTSWVQSNLDSRKQ